ncbi:CLUMA_CG017320, isoform A [Clunio marinus]|uniref:CLUMA_CG017320, isoform A n=1 Tax=Clunio marinus TaxID=568069 RepID=A0A1J1J027_9DIPT|nr:CLUMA_CG017320, isoform A [Clunio marinus]
MLLRMGALSFTTKSTSISLKNLNGNSPSHPMRLPISLYIMSRLLLKCLLGSRRTFKKLFLNAWLDKIFNVNKLCECLAVEI